MPPRRDVVIIGAGHNGLVAAFYLAKAGLRPLVLERRPIVGGVAVTEEFHPGFRVSTLAHTAGPIAASILRDMQLEQHGLRWIEPEPRVLALPRDGRPLLLYGNVERTVAELTKSSLEDAKNYREFQQVLARIAAVLAPLLNELPPDLDRTNLTDLLLMLRTGRGVRKLGDEDMYRLLRWAPMPVADLLGEWFSNELLRAAIAARALYGTAMGPMSAGSSMVLLLRAAAEHAGSPAGATIAGSSSYPVGGMGALTSAMAAAAHAAGAEIRTLAEVERIVVTDGAVFCAVLKGGEEIAAHSIVSNADPKRTLLSLVGPEHLGPQLLMRLENFRQNGTSAKMNVALNALPMFKALPPGSHTVQDLAGRIHIGPTIEYLERAYDASKYGGFSEQPMLEITIPSISDSSLAPAGKHVMSVHMQYAAFKLRDGNWSAQEQRLGDAIIGTLAQYAPDLPSQIVGGQLITPAQMESTFGLTGGHLFHGDLSLEQLFSMRPLMEWSRYRMPIRGLYLCGSGTHPGIALTGQSGANAARAVLKNLKR